MVASKKVLLAEGDRTSAEQIIARVEASGNRVALMGKVDAASVVEAAKRIKPHVIVLGDKSDRTQAAAAVRMLKSDPVTAEIPVIVIDQRPRRHGCTGITRLEGLQLESEDYFTKPLEMASFVARLDQLLEETSKPSVPATPSGAPAQIDTPIVGGAGWPQVAGA